jgi:nucleotide-binding universal stress UspA family protein
MKILATFDGSPCSEAILPQLTSLARGPEDQVTLFSVVEPPGGGVRMRGPLRPVVGVAAMPGTTPLVVEQTSARYVETKGQAVERAVADREDYLHGLQGKLLQGSAYTCKAVTGEDPARAIIEEALHEGPDVIVMATHGHSGLVHILFGDVAEEVVRSGVAPVLLIHPEAVRDARDASRARTRARQEAP